MKPTHWQERLVGDINWSWLPRSRPRRPPARFRTDTLASMDRVEKIAKNTKARVVVQHDPQDFQALPKFPAYLD
jgi:N-acyl homoserine lactone hydrolase